MERGKGRKYWKKVKRRCRDKTITKKSHHPNHTQQVPTCSLVNPKTHEINCSLQSKLSQQDKLPNTGKKSTRNTFVYDQIIHKKKMSSFPNPFLR